MAGLLKRRLKIDPFRFLEIQNQKLDPGFSLSLDFRRIFKINPAMHPKPIVTEPRKK